MAKLPRDFQRRYKSDIHLTDSVLSVVVNFVLCTLYFVHRDQLVIAEERGKHQKVIDEKVCYVKALI